MARPRATQRERDIVRRHFFEVYEMYARNKEATAQALGVTVKTVYNRLRDYAAEGVTDAITAAEIAAGIAEALCDAVHARRYAR